LESDCVSCVICDWKAAAEVVAEAGKADVYGAREGGGKGVSVLLLRRVSSVVSADGYCKDQREVVSL
jgi:hypothetical protein